MFTNTRETHSALGPALQAAFKLMSPTGGRVSLFQTQLPSLGAGLLQSREDPNQRSSTKVFYVSSSLIFKIMASTSIDLIIWVYFSNSLIVKKKKLVREFNSNYHFVVVLQCVLFNTLFMSHRNLEIIYYKPFFTDEETDSTVLPKVK